MTGLETGAAVIASVELEQVFVLIDIVKTGKGTYQGGLCLHSADGGFCVVVYGDGRQIGVDQVSCQGSTCRVVIVFLVVSYQQLDIVGTGKGIFICGVGIDGLIDKIIPVLCYLGRICPGE